MASTNTGKRIMEIMQMLKQYKNHDICEADLNELMVVPKKKTLFSVLFYIMDLLYERWRFECSPVLLSKKDETRFLAMACKHINQLRKDFVVVRLPSVTQSSLASLHGEKFGQVFYKFLCAIMLKLIEKEGFSDEKESSTEEISDLEQKLAELEKRVEEKKAVKQSVMKKEQEILEHIATAANWDESVKVQLLDLNNDKMINECVKSFQNCKEERNRLEKELSPYFNHMGNCKDQCSCDSKYILNEGKSSAISALLLKRIHVKTDFQIRDLKSRAAVRRALQGHSGNEETDSDLQKLIAKLESLRELRRSSPLKFVKVPFQDSPAVQYETDSSPCNLSIFENVSPALVESNRVLAKYEEQVKVDVASLPLLWQQRGVTVTTSPGTVPPRMVLFPRRPAAASTAEPRDLFSIVRRLQAASGCKPRRSNSFHFENIPENNIIRFGSMRKYGSELMTPLQPNGPSDEINSRRVTGPSTKPRCMLSRRRLTDNTPFKAARPMPFKEDEAMPCNGAKVLPCNGAEVLPCKGVGATLSKGGGATLSKKAEATPFKGAGSTPFKGAEATPFKGAGATPFKVPEATPFKPAGVTPSSAREVNLKNEQVLDMLVHKMIADTDLNDTFSDGDWSPDRIASSTHSDMTEGPGKEFGKRIPDRCSQNAAGDGFHFKQTLEKEDRRLRGLDSSFSSTPSFLKSDNSSIVEGKEGEEEEEELLAEPLDLLDVEELEPEAPELNKSLQDIINRYMAIKSKNNGK